MTKVNHKLFGTGTVVNNDAKTVTVDFSGELKTMVLKFANLLNEDGTSFKPAKVKKLESKTYAVPIEYVDGRSDMQLLQAVLDCKKTGEWA